MPCAIALTGSTIQSPKRPESHLFVGASGVGKSALSELRAEHDGAELFTIDLSEYTQKHDVARLVGAPPGYEGFKEGGSLINALLRNPKLHIRFDEIDKAHRDFQNILLQILDGRLSGTKAGGEVVTVDLRHTVITVTTNDGRGVVYGGRDVLALDDDDEAVRARLAARGLFKTEVLNRFGSIDVFDDLTHDDVRQIARIRIEALRRLLARKGMTLDVTEKAVEWLAHHGFSETMGARPMERLVDRVLKGAVVNGLDDGRFAEGQKLRAQFEEAVDHAGQLQKRVVVRRDDDATPEGTAAVAPDVVHAAETMEAQLANRVRGQRRPVRVVAAALRRLAVGLADPERPMSFLFAGPSGAGKTELGHRVADVTGGKRLKLDMSDFAQPQQVLRLTGAANDPAGGQLTNAVLADPEITLIFDELEKSHPDAQDLLLQILEDGRLTDGMGRVVDFRRAKIVATTNAGKGDIYPEHASHDGDDDGDDEIVDDDDEEIRVRLGKTGAFRSELINRFDEVAVFNHLSRRALRQIVGQMLDKVRQRLRARKITLHTTDHAENLLVDHGYSSELGARPLRRTVERLVTNRVTDGIVAGDFPDDSTVRVQVEDGRLALRHDHDTTPESVGHGTHPPARRNRNRPRASSGHETSSRSGFRPAGQPHHY